VAGVATKRIPPPRELYSFHRVVGDFASEDIFVSLVEFGGDVGAVAHGDCSTSFAAAAASQQQSWNKRPKTQLITPFSPSIVSFFAITRDGLLSGTSNSGLSVIAATRSPLPVRVIRDRAVFLETHPISAVA